MLNHIWEMSEKIYVSYEGPGFDSLTLYQSAWHQEHEVKKPIFCKRQEMTNYFFTSLFDYSAGQGSGSKREKAAALMFISWWELSGSLQLCPAISRHTQGYEVQLLRQFPVRACSLCIVPCCYNGKGIACRTDEFWGISVLWLLLW